MKKIELIDLLLIIVLCITINVLVIDSKTVAIIKIIVCLIIFCLALAFMIIKPIINMSRYRCNKEILINEGARKLNTVIIGNLIFILAYLILIPRIMFFIKILFGASLTSSLVIIFVLAFAPVFAFMLVFLVYNTFFILGFDISFMLLFVLSYFFIVIYNIMVIIELKVAGIINKKQLVFGILVDMIPIGSVIESIYLHKCYKKMN